MLSFPNVLVPLATSCVVDYIYIKALMGKDDFTPGYTMPPITPEEWAVLNAKRKKKEEGKLVIDSPQEMELFNDYWGPNGY